MMKDIQVIGGDLDYDKLKEVLPSVYDRIKSIFYHCKLIEIFCSTRDFQKAIWHFRGALSEFKSLFYVLPYDLRRLKFDKIWKRSEFHKKIENDVLIQILKKTRDLAVHTDHIKGDKRKFCFKLLDGDKEHDISSERIFIDPIDRKHFDRDNSNRDCLRKKIKTPPDKGIEWFNRQTKIWPAHLIIKESIFRTCGELINFLTIRRVAE